MNDQIDGCSNAAMATQMGITPALDSLFSLFDPTRACYGSRVMIDQAVRAGTRQSILHEHDRMPWGKVGRYL
jgi:hypothetical protein